MISLPASAPTTPARRSTPTGQAVPVPRFGQILLRDGAVSAEALSEALELQRQDGGRLGEVLLRQGLVTKQQIARTLAEQFGLPYHDLTAEPPSLEAMVHLPVDLCRSCGVVPVKVESPGLWVGLVDPTNARARETVEGLVAGHVVEWLVVAPDALEAALEAREDPPLPVTAAPGVVGHDGLRLLSAKGEVVEARACGTARVLVEILERAVREGADEVYLEADGPWGVVRFRVDGRVGAGLAVSSEEHRALLARLADIAGLAEGGVQGPQRGHFSLVTGRGHVPVEANLLPVVGGQSVALHLSSADEAPRDLAALGFSYACQAKLQGALAGAPGLVVVAGQARSGRSTTLRALTKQATAASGRVVCLTGSRQAPVPGVQTVLVGPEAGVGWSEAYAAAVLHDPGVLALDGVCDEQSAAVCAEAAMSGRMVLAAVTAGSTREALLRLRLLGVGSSVLAASLSAVCWQHLVRLPCEQCGAEREVPVAALARLRQALGGAELPRVEKRGSGCPACGFTGYRGREAMAEVAVLDASVPGTLLTETPGEVLCSPTALQGTNLAEAACAKIEQGRTTVAEVLAALSGRGSI